MLWLKSCGRNFTLLINNVSIPCDAHHYGNNDGDLHGTDDGGDQDVVQLLSTGDHVEDVEVLRLVTLRTFVSCVTSESDIKHDCVM